MISVVGNLSAIFFLFVMIFLFTGMKRKPSRAISENKITSLTKFQFLHTNMLEIIIQFLNIDDFSKFQSICQNSKSLNLQKKFCKISKIFFNKVHVRANSPFHFCKYYLIEYVDSKGFISVFLPLYQRGLGSPPKTKHLSKFIDHAIQSHNLRFIKYIDGSFSIEHQLNHQYLFLDIATTFNSIPNFSSKFFENFVVNHDKTIIMVFKHAEITFDLENKIEVCIFSDMLKILFQKIEVMWSHIFCFMILFLCTMF